MESNWRFNVWDWGQDLGVYTLIARKLLVPTEWIAWKDVAYGGYEVMKENPVGGHYLVDDHVVLVPPGTRFPCGVPVEPDS